MADSTKSTFLYMRNNAFMIRGVAAKFYKRASKYLRQEAAFTSSAAFRVHENVDKWM